MLDEIMGAEKVLLLEKGEGNKVNGCYAWDLVAGSLNLKFCKKTNKFLQLPFLLPIK